jgi:hypothetical protein
MNTVVYTTQNSVLQKPSSVKMTYLANLFILLRFLVGFKTFTEN